MSSLTAPEHRAADHIAARDAQIPSSFLLPADTIPLNPAKLYRTSGRLNEREVQIVEHDATGLAQAIAAGTYTSVEVIHAFIKSAVIAHSATSCLAWLDVEAALKQAEELDAIFAKTGKTVGPMHGVPMSVKDFMFVTGFAQSAGHISSAGVRPDYDAAIVEIFRAAGVVFYAKTTQPQSIMHLETSNFFGTTLCSHNRNLTSGGSSGGEGALVGCRGSIIGITTDVGGSTRNPAANNGLWGFKGSSKRVPRAGVDGITSHSRIAGCVGPVCHSLRDIHLWAKVLLDGQAWKRDIKLVHTPWRDAGLDGTGCGFNGWSGEDNRLRVGIMMHDGQVRPVRPIRRAMEEMKVKMETTESAGIEVVHMPAPEGLWAEAWKITKALYYTDGGKLLRKALGEEKMMPLTEWITDGIRDLTREEVDAYVARRNEIRQQYYDYFNSLSLDALLCPVGPAPAQPIGTTKYWPYTSMWNLLDWPAAVFPTGLHVEEEDEVMEEEEARNEDEAHLYRTYSTKVAIGSPICLQLVAPRWQDERLLAALGVLERLLPL